MHHSYLDKYSSGNSIIHRLDSRTKLLFTLVIILIVIITPATTWYAFALSFIVVAGIICLSRLPIFYVLKRSLLILPFVGVIAISIPFVKQGEIIASISVWSWNISVTRTGLELFLSILVKGWLSILSLILLTSTTKMADILKGLNKLHVPYILTTIMSFMYRYIFVLTDEIMRMKQARDSRGYGMKKLQNIKAAGNMIGILFVRSYERAERVYSAMLARGYDSQVHAVKQSKFQTIDVIFALGVFLFLAMASWLILFTR